MCRLTNHSKDRLKERMGLNKKSIKRIAQKALDDGLKHSDFSGSFLRYLDGLYLKERNANNMRVYSNEVFLFVDDVLVTVIDIPQKYMKTVKNVKSKNGK